MSTGVLVMAHGTPADPEGILPFYTRIRRGRPPTDEQLADLVRRYEAIGGTSPLAARTAAQVAGLTEALEALAPGAFVVRFGAKHTEPSIEDAARALGAVGVDQVVGLVLAPHRSSMGSEEYLERARAALEGTPFLAVRQWYGEEGFADLVAERLVEAVEAVPTRPQVVVFTAHSLPERVLAAGDPYPDQVHESADLVAEAAGLPGREVTWRVAWQSAGRTPEPWIGPDLLNVIPELAAAGARGVVVCPVGFVSDHLEVLYDVDVEARAVAERVGLQFARSRSLDADPRLCALLARVVAERAQGRGHG